jgi:hypothetical protein
LAQEAFVSGGPVWRSAGRREPLARGGDERAELQTVAFEALLLQIEMAEFQRFSTRKGADECGSFKICSRQLCANYAAGAYRTGSLFQVAHKTP